MSMPTIRKMKEVAKPGNQPECMAATPTSSSDTRADMAAKRIHATNMRGLISLRKPHTTASPIATTA